MSEEIGNPQNPLALTRTNEEKEYHFRELESIQPGEVIANRYTIKKFLGRGGFGVVFAAYDRVLCSEVALKLLHPGLSLSPRKFKRVRREINLSRKITDSRIVKIFSLEAWHGLYFLVMELVKGRSLADYLKSRSGPIPWQEFSEIFLSILEAVEALHRHGIVHRDIKPSNIFLVGKNIKILDFGAAKEMDDPEQTAELGEIIGSPLYMSPEQISGRAVGPASDVYQLGLILYQALSGHSPFPNQSGTVELLLKHMHETPPPIKLVNAYLPQFLNQVVLRSLEKNPRHRFPDVACMSHALRRGRLPRLRISLRKFRRSAWILGAGVLVLVVLMWRGRPFQLKDVAVDETRVLGMNALGISSWRRDFSPHTIYQATMFSLEDAVPEFWQIVPKGRFGVRVISVPLQNKAFPGDSSLGTLDADSRLVLMDGRGRNLLDQSFTRIFQLDPHGYTRRFYPYGFSERDLNRDGLSEQMMLVRHSQGMFPSALVILRGGGFSVFTSPGVIENYRILDANHPGVTLQILAMANPVAHMKYLIRVRMNLAGNWQFQHALPGSQVDAGTVGQEEVVLLPPGARIEREGPGGSVVFQDSYTLERIEYQPEGGLTIVSPGGESKSFRDETDGVFLALNSIQRAYAVRLQRHDFAAARKELDAVFSLELGNPYLRSALFYLRGDLHAEAAEYASARVDFENALRIYPFNMDAACRLTETVFLQGDALAAEQMVNERFGNHYMFWGLSNGRRLFLLWMDLHHGRFRKALERVKSLFYDKPGLAITYGGLVDLFRGNYDQACDAFEKAGRLPPNLFTVAEFRLFYARALVAAGRKAETARFLLQDLKTHSPRQGWRTGMLQAWLDAQGGDRSPGLKLRVQDAWERVLQRARGDFQARLWLFLDAWCYGRVMDWLNETAAAREGYRNCLGANPFSGAAADARRRLIIQVK